MRRRCRGLLRAASDRALLLFSHTCGPAGFTQEQLTKIRCIVKESGTGVQGCSRSPVENARALQHVATHQHHGLSYDAAIKATAKAELASPSTIRHAAKQFIATGSLPLSDTSLRGSGNPSHPLHSPAEPSFEVERAIHRCWFEASKEVRHVAIKHIQLLLLEQEQVHVSEWTLRRWLHEIGYAWDDKTFIGALTPQYRDVRIRSFIWEYANALRQQQDGTYIIVYLDESYIKQFHQMKKGWHPIAGPHKNNETRGEAGRGKRLIIVHAMSHDGMLEVEDAVGSNFLHEVTPTAQFVFEAASFDDSDYHNSIDGEAFTLWVKNRLLPAFHQLYPDKKMILVMDNAGYHKPRDFDWVAPAKMGKAECASFLEAQGITAFKAEREDAGAVVFPKRTWLLNARNKAAPTVKELRAAVKAHLKQHPQLNQTKIDKMLRPLGHSIIWTPPFVPEVQPIELIWAYVKGLVASQYTLHRSIETTRQQTDDAFDTITAAMIQKRIKHCHAWIDAFMKTEEAGSLQAYGSLDALIQAKPDTATPSDIESIRAEEAESDELDESAQE